jgi:hypothetical protein
MKEDSKFDEYFQEGLKQFHSGKFAESLAEFFNAAQVDPSSSDLHYYIGEALERKRQLDEPETAGSGKAVRSKKATRRNKRFTQVLETKTTLPNVENLERDTKRYPARIPLIVVAYDSQGKFFAELAMTKVTSVKGACIDMHRRVKIGAQLMIFTIDSRNAVPALVRNVRLDEERARYLVGIEFLKGPVDWLVPS